MVWVFQKIYDNAQFKKILNEIQRILKKEGLIFVVDNVYPDNRKLISTSNLGDIYSGNNNSTPLRFFSDNSVLSCMKKIGLKRIKYQLIGHSFFELYKK